jgi:hypothetical protein
MIKSFRHAGIERFFATGSKAGIQPSHAATAFSIPLFTETGKPSGFFLTGAPADGSWSVGWK